MLVVSLGTDPYQIVVDGREFLEARSTTQGIDDGYEIILRAPATQEGPANFLKNKKANQNILVSGELSLYGKGDDGWKEKHDDDGRPVIRVSACCDATDQQFFNEITIVGRYTGEPKEAEKSCSRSIAVNRFSKKMEKEVGDFFRVRGFKSTKPGKSSWGERILNATKGTLVEINGMLTAEKSKDGGMYPVVKVRRIRTHKTGSGGSQANPAKEKAASGYEHSQFTETDDQMPSSNW